MLPCCQLSHVALENEPLAATFCELDCDKFVRRVANDNERKVTLHANIGAILIHVFTPALNFEH
jgi:hypothetical protein